jgi:hypothetical protein
MIEGADVYLHRVERSNDMYFVGGVTYQKNNTIIYRFEEQRRGTVPVSKVIVGFIESRYGGAVY